VAGRGLPSAHAGKPEQQRCGLLGLGRSCEDRAVVVTQELEPMLDVARVVFEMRDRQAEFGAEDRARQFGDQLFGGIGRSAEAVLEVAAQAACMTGPVRQFVGKRGVVVIEAGEQVRRRHGHPVGAELVISFIALVTQCCRNRGKERIQLGFAAFRLDQLEPGGRAKPFGQTLYLVGVEHGIGLEDAADFVGPLAGVGRFHLLGVALVENGDRRLFTLADLGAERLRLIVCHPVGRGVTAHVGDHPQPEHVHAAIGNAASAQRPRPRHSAPGFDPRLGSGLEPGDDLLGNAGGGRQSAAVRLAVGHDGSPVRQTGNIAGQ
jgi:hypothetical protein